MKNASHPWKWVAILPTVFSKLPGVLYLPKNRKILEFWPTFAVLPPRVPDCSMVPPRRRTVLESDCSGTGRVVSQFSDMSRPSGLWPPVLDPPRRHYSRVPKSNWIVPVVWSISLERIKRLLEWWGSIQETAVHGWSGHLVVTPLVVTVLTSEHFLIFFSSHLSPVCICPSNTSAIDVCCSFSFLPRNKKKYEKENTNSYSFYRAFTGSTNLFVQFHK